MNSVNDIESLIEIDKDLSGMNTMGVPSSADYFISVNESEHLKSTIAWAHDKGVEFIVLAGGSNVILPSRYSGLVIHPNFRGVTHEDCSDVNNGVDVTVGAGMNWHGFVSTCVDAGWYGVENLALIPGDCGAAPVQNIGAYGVELNNRFKSLKAFDISVGEVVTLDKHDCGFAYRDSIFKSSAKGRYIIVEITLTLSREDNVVAHYPALKEFFKQRSCDIPKAKDVFEAVIHIRKSKLPDPLDTPNAGSFFKNPIVPLEKFSELKDRFPNVVAFDVGTNKKKLAAAWMIEKAGWKGKSFSGLKVHDQHALVVTNPNHCSAADVLNMAQAICDDVKQQFGVSLEMEPQAIQ